MTDKTDPTLPIREKAASYAEVVTGTSCNQHSFKTKKGSYLFIGPGAKGIGYKAMLKLTESMAEGQELADKDPDHYEVGNTGWVTIRFSKERPFPETRWRKWLDESYDLVKSR